MIINWRPSASLDPLFPQSALLPLSHAGGVQLAMDNRPGVLRPFVATLGVPRPVNAKKHDTSATEETKPTQGDTSKDGVVVPDSVSDTETDS